MICNCEIFQGCVFSEFTLLRVCGETWYNERRKFKRTLWATGGSLEAKEEAEPFRGVSGWSSVINELRLIC